jgi:4-hydroxy-tetrahydrodipicolinate synthase
MTDIRNSLRGMTTPVVTPFDGHEIDWESYDRLLAHLVEGGVDGVFPCGTTGEFASLTADERSRLVSRTVDVTPSDVSVVVGGTGTAIEEAIAWIETAADIGADAGAVTAPYFHTSNDPDGLRRFFERVADDSPIPVVLYNNPVYVGEPIPSRTVGELATHESVVGLKDASGDLTYASRVEDRVPEEFLLLQGFDSLLLASMRMGFDGGMNMLSNVMPGAFVEILDAPGSDRAHDIHRDAIVPLFERGRAEGFAPVTKTVLAEHGIISSNDVRPSLVPVEADLVETAMARADSVLS